MIIEVIRGLNMGGAETLLYTRLRYLQSVDPSRLSNITVINTLSTANYYSSLLREIGVRVIELEHANPVRGALELRNILRSLSGVRAVVFHSPVATYLEKVRRLLTSRKDWAFLEVVHSTQYRSLYMHLSRWLDPAVDRAIAVSEAVAHADVCRNFREITTIEAGVDIDRMRKWVSNNPAAPDEFRRQLALPMEGRLLVTVGSLIPLKGQRHAIESLRHESMSDCCLVLVGEGAEKSSLERLVNDLDLTDRVRFVGRVNEGWRWTAVADAIVHPSIFEGLPVALMEAAALGTPIVATDVGGIAQILARGASGRLIDYAQPAAIATAVNMLIGSGRLRHAIFERRASASSYWSVERYASEYNMVIDREAIAITENGDEVI